MNEKEQNLPFVSCIMPTYNRRIFVPHAIQYFLRQDYSNKELIIIDDGTDNIEDLVPDNPSLHYYRLDTKITLGAKLNIACQYAQGDIIANWDDDDWYAPRRLSYQLDALKNDGTLVCGINTLLYFDINKKSAFRYIYPPNQRVWLLGSSLCYKKELWQQNKFADINIGMDGLFVWATQPQQVKVLKDFTFSVHMIHDHNVSPKKTEGVWWNPYPVADLKILMNEDWHIYSNGAFYKSENISQIECKPQSKVVTAPIIVPPSPLKNVFACLIHENEKCVIDLVRNLHFHDPSSVIILYNGSTNPDLIQNHFPYEKYGAVIYPNPIPVNYGYLHNFALKCMQFASANFSFDTFTIVDSDQLAIRSGYSSYLRKFFFSGSNIGVFSSEPKRLTTPADIRHTDATPALQAFNEFDLWKPFLRNFSEGEKKIFHWTFWPSAIFTSNAIHDLINIFKENKQLQYIMEHTKIWATEEVILPTLVRLLGYEIVSNPCTYNYVKYGKSYSPIDIDQALNKTDVFWVHPVSRNYQDPIRKYIREQFNNYAPVNNTVSCGGTSSRDLFLTLPLLNKIRAIEGWLEDGEADLLIGIMLKVFRDLPPPYNIVEIGSYQGKSTVLFGGVIKKLFYEAKVYSIDPHDGLLGAADQGLKSFPPSFKTLKRNITDSGLADVVDIIKNSSYNVKWNLPISLLFIDGLHDYDNVTKDFRHFSDWIKPGGYVAFHDYVDYFPGVQVFVNELLNTGTYRRIHRIDSLIILQKV